MLNFFRASSTARPFHHVAVVAILLGTSILFFLLFYSSPIDEAVVLPQDPWQPGNFTASRSEVTIVVGKLSKEDTSWLAHGFPDWDHRVYVVDDKHAALKVPVNKGREAMVYLTYIIDNYDSLSPVTIFRHSARYQWHTDDPLYDGQRALQRLQIPYVQSQGYVNLRCSWVLGCPVEINPFTDPKTQPADHTGPHYKKAFEELFPDEPVPLMVGTPCCAEFAVTANTIRKRPQSDYTAYRDWLIHTKLANDISGRVLEYAWHILFGLPAVHCPNARDCYCGLYGLCDLKCQDEGTCQSQYTLPPYATMPKGWPDIDWDGNPQNASAM